MDAGKFVLTEHLSIIRVFDAALYVRGIAMSIRLGRFGVAAGLVALIASLGLATSSNPASANTLNVVGGAIPGLDIDLTVTVNSGSATFLFKNNSTGGASGSGVHEIYFESGLASLLKTPVTPDDTGTLNASLKAPANPALPPDLGGWVNLLGVAYDNQSGTLKGNAGMIQVGDAWAITFALVNNLTSATDILNAVFNQSGNSRIAMHIGECVPGDSCVATVVGDPGGGGGGGEVPLPGAVILFGSVLAGTYGAAKWRRRKQHTSAV